MVTNPAGAYAPRPATYDDLLKVPDILVAELIDGVLYTSPRPASPHALSTSQIAVALGPPFHGKPGPPERPGGWWILFEPELHLAKDVLVPDLAGWRRDRMPKIPNAAAFELPPDWVCEVISPRSAGLDRVKKLGVYGRFQVAHAWIVDPIARTLEVVRRHDNQWILAGTYAGLTEVRAEPFDAVALDMSQWWIEED